MKKHARVAVIGGGVVGASVLYHLTKAGWKDVLLIERAELTSGSTWHAAGGMHTVNGDPNVAKLQQYTIELYKEIERISGQSCGVHITGGVMLAGTRERLDWLKMAKARGRYFGMDFEIISVDEAAKLFPLMDKKHFVGAMFDPIEGHVDPYGVTHAYAKSAQLAGAQVVRHSRVVDLKLRRDGSWDVITEHGNVHTEHVVNAGGLWAREGGRMVGLELPILAMEHQAPDGNPLVGPVKGLRNFWVACGVMAGFSQGGGVGLALSQWMVEGDPGADIWAMDVARYGDWATLAYTNAKG